MTTSDDRLSRIMAEFGPRRDVESRRVLATLRRQLFGRGSSASVARFERLERLAHGGMGVVYRAWDPVLRRRVAIKVLHPSASKRALVIGEARALAALSHPNVVSILDFGQERDELFIVMEYFAGDTLGDVMRRGVSLPRLVELLARAAEGLAAAHARGIVHHDIKPSNILISQAGEVKVVDFGLAHVLDEGGPRGGTVGFAAPEQLEGQNTDARTDIYAMTAIVQVAASGLQPAPRSLRRFLRRGLHRDPAKRPQTAESWIRELRRATTPPGRRLAFGALSLVGAVGIVSSLRALGSESPCAVPASVSPWSAEERSRVQANLESTGLPMAADAFARADARLDAVTGRWLDAHARACRSTNPARLACTRAQRAGLDAMVEWLATLEPRDVPRVSTALRGLPEPRLCDDTRSSDDAMEPFDAALARARLMIDAGRYSQARALLSEMPRPQDTPTNARRLRQHAALLGRAQTLSGEYAAAAATHERAYLLALVGDEDDAAAEHAADLAALHAAQLWDPLGAERWIRNSEISLKRAADPSAQTRGQVSLGIAGAHLALGNLELAQREIENAEAAFADDSPARVDVATVSAAISYQRGDPAAALEAQQRGLEVARSVFGEDHPRLVAPMNNIGILLQELGQPERAVEVLDQALALAEHALGPHHVQTAQTRLSVASMSVGLRPPADCVAMFEHGLADLEASLGMEHPGLNTALQGLANALLEDGRPAEAERVVLRAIDIAKRDDTLEPRVRAALFSTHAAVQRQLGRPEAAVQSASQALAIIEGELGSRHPHVILVRLELAACHEALGDPLAANAQREAAVVVARDAFGPEHAETKRLQAMLDRGRSP